MFDRCLFIITGFGLMLLTVPVSADCPLTRKTLNQEFKIAEESKDKAAALRQKIEAQYSVDAPDCPVFVTAYYGALKTLEAKFSSNSKQTSECAKRLTALYGR